ncbi:unnamed protein product [Paramecium sonneborni]|uniref:Uncharacterized protein n=1 Tax=Paramecium sonneborni TaxID=65129 RepID=A0A8S1NVZ7_9CILI|nr:unnamed protein product [Paramecium sonneborni]
MTQPNFKIDSIIQIINKRRNFESWIRIIACQQLINNKKQFEQSLKRFQKNSIKIINKKFRKRINLKRLLNFQIKNQLINRYQFNQSKLIQRKKRCLQFQELEDQYQLKQSWLYNKKEAHTQFQLNFSQKIRKIISKLQRMK